ncbi:MAG TPA: hypothetical protein VN706_12930 [Gemmatimonadaceae bacterium]|nr:hypothetical protein [Gemmatimonadaceae bacterium]
MPKTIERAARGAAAGAVATIPMTAVMLAAKHTGSMGQLPPEKITRRALAAANQQASTPATKAAAAVAHFGFGAAAGAAFAMIADERDELPAAMAKGAGFGLALYALSPRTRSMTSSAAMASSNATGGGAPSRIARATPR